MILMFNAGPAAAAPAKGPIKLVAFGDSLTAGYGVMASDAFPVVLEKALKAKGFDVTVLNSGVSGDTAAAGLDRLDWAVPDDAQAVIVELGANDSLRGIAPSETLATLDRLLQRLADRKLPVLLAGMRAPRNWGEDYARAFDAIFPALAAKHGAILYPFFLDGVVLDRSLNQGDGIHPTGRGVTVIVERMLPQVEELLKRVEAAGAGSR